MRCFLKISVLVALPLSDVVVAKPRLSKAENVARRAVNDSSSGVALSILTETGVKNATAPLLYGWMFEDINHSGDGGLYGELLTNRAFEGSDVAFGIVPGFVGNTITWQENACNPAGKGLFRVLEDLPTDVPRACHRRLQARGRHVNSPGQLSTALQLPSNRLGPRYPDDRQRGLGSSRRCECRMVGDSRLATDIQCLVLHLPPSIPEPVQPQYRDHRVAAVQRHGRDLGLNSHSSSSVECRELHLRDSPDCKHSQCS